MAAVKPGGLVAYLALLRPRQGTKNVVCLGGVLFSGRFTDSVHVGQALLTFVAFCGISSATYVWNDILDRESDRQHPRKCRRPIASGAVAVPAAVLMGVLVGAAGLGLASLLGSGVLLCLLLYLVNTVAYSLWLKHQILLDVLSIALGFVLRLVAGVYAVDDVPTTWIALCTFFLALFLAFGKRRAELAALITVEDQKQRPVLSQYTVPYLDAQVNSAAVMAVLCYALFTATSADKDPTLVITVPIVWYAIMYYKRLLGFLEKGEEPERIVLSEPRILISVVLWLATYLAITYGELRLWRR
jgi:4-hydroxybenzoate polyprenyltransferase